VPRARQCESYLLTSRKYFNCRNKLTISLTQTLRVVNKNFPTRVKVEGGGAVGKAAAYDDGKSHAARKV